MKYITLIIIIILSVGCTSLTNTHEPEEMADLASQLKDLSAAVDGTLKFSSTAYTDSQTLLMAAINNDAAKLSPFEGYQLNVIVKGNNAVLLLCKEDLLLIEDAGCTAQSDIQHWQSANGKTCELTLNTNQICNF